MFLSFFATLEKFGCQGLDWPAEGWLFFLLLGETCID